MKSLFTKKVGGLLPVLLILAACSSSGKLELLQAKTAPIPPGKSVSLTVTSSQTEDADRMVQRLRAELFGRLVSEAVFKQVLQPGENGDYSMKIQVLNAEVVSQGARIFFGVLAGANKLRTTVRLVEVSSGQVVTEFDVDGESASHPFSTESGLDDAVREVVSKVILALR